MKCSRTVFLFLYLIIASEVCKSQPLQIGDLVPDIRFQLLDSKPRAIKLSDYRGKVVILDFWATWCGSCIKALPKLDELQKQYEGKIEILMINSTSTRDSEEKVSAYIKTFKKRYPAFQMQNVVNDSIAENYFPFKNFMIRAGKKGKKMGKINFNKTFEIANDSLSLVHY